MVWAAASAAMLLTPLRVAVAFPASVSLDLNAGTYRIALLRRTAQSFAKAVAAAATSATRRVFRLHWNGITCGTGFDFSRQHAVADGEADISVTAKAHSSTSPVW